jgi:hypothetical protein
MSSKGFLLSAAAAALTNLLLHAAAYFLFLKDFYRAHPAGPEEFVQQLNRPPGQLVGWALAVSALTMGLLIAAVMRWAAARTFVAGLRAGAILGVLFWASVNFGLFSSAHVFSLASVVVDTVSSATVMTIASAMAAEVLGRGSTATATRPAGLRSPGPSGSPIDPGRPG